MHTLKKILAYPFGYDPTKSLPTFVYNSIMATVGAALLAHDWTTFFGLVLLMESIIVSIERCWPKGERPE
jgi:hypothetical protein